MAILKIARMGNPVLMDRAQEVSDPADPEIRRLVEDMIETMADAGGVGLAAPQVHASLRIVIYQVPGARLAAEEEEEGAFDDEDGGPAALALTVLINPEIEPLGEEMDEAMEACLSVPDLAGKVPRHRHIRLRAQSLDGEWSEIEADGFHARVLQHECDHLDGILYPMRMTDLSTLTFTSELGKRRAEGD
jgi:peptide deformylase